MAAVPGAVVTFTDEDNKTWAATVINTFTNDESEDMVTLSVYGKGDTVVMKDSELD
jgi:hypothetical protein